MPAPFAMPAENFNIGTTIGKVRFALGDNIFGSGPLPDGGNFADEQIQYLLDENGDESGQTQIMRTVADLCEVLAMQWTVVSDISVGSRNESLGAVSDKWQARADKLRAQYGGNGNAGRAFSVGVVRSDGYSENGPLSAGTDTEFSE